jgi:hypothetical protein
MNSIPGEGNLLVCWQTSRGSVYTSTPAGWTVHSHGPIGPGADYARMMYRTATASESINVIVAADPGTPGGYNSVWEIEGTDLTPDTSSFDEVDTGTFPATIDAGTVTPTAGSPGIIILGYGVHCSDYIGPGHSFVTVGSGFTEDAQPWGDAHPLHVAAHQIVTSTTGSYATTSTMGGFTSNFGGWGGETLVFLGATGGEQNPPAPGQDIGWLVPTAVPDGEDFTWDLGFPFSDGSLEVRLDGQDQTGAVTSYDGACGEFTVSFEVQPGELLEARGIGR